MNIYIRNDNDGRLQLDWSPKMLSILHITVFSAVVMILFSFPDIAKAERGYVTYAEMAAYM
ncbi:MAG TPA: hypothetical protein DCR95_02525, partial [Desulfobacter sp.]|nr:hypothetical protein [Desulfobacter sp.]